MNSNPAAMKEFYDLLRATSRTFSVGIEALPDELRDAVTLAYLVLRVSDYFEDSPSLPADEKYASLNLWADMVEAVAGGIDPSSGEALVRSVSAADGHLPDHRAATRAPEILKGLRALSPSLRDPIQRHTAATTRGMANWVLRGDYFPDEPALDDYMFEVAGRVGLLLTDLFSAHSASVRLHVEELGKIAVPFGLGLQTVNVIRGLHEDPERGWSYIPQNLLPNLVERPDPRVLDIADQMRILDFLVRKSGRHIGDALRYCQLLPRRERGIRIFCIIPALLAARTAQLSQNNPNVFRTPVKMSRKAVTGIVFRSRCLYFSNSWLEKERTGALRLAEQASPSPAERNG